MESLRRARAFALSRAFACAGVKSPRTLSLERVRRPRSESIDTLLTFMPQPDYSHLIPLPRGRGANDSILARAQQDARFRIGLCLFFQRRTQLGAAAVDA